jgi:hypothetical protein
MGKQICREGWQIAAFLNHRFGRRGNLAFTRIGGGSGILGGG